MFARAVAHSRNQWHEITVVRGAASLEPVGFPGPRKPLPSHDRVALSPKPRRPRPKKNTCTPTPRHPGLPLLTRRERAKAPLRPSTSCPHAPPRQNKHSCHHFPLGYFLLGRCSEGKPSSSSACQTGHDRAALFLSTAVVARSFWRIIAKTRSPSRSVCGEVVLTPPKSNVSNERLLVTKSNRANVLRLGFSTELDAR